MRSPITQLAAAFGSPETAATFSIVLGDGAGGGEHVGIVLAQAVLVDEAGAA